MGNLIVKNTLRFNLRGSNFQNFLGASMGMLFMDVCFAHTMNIHFLTPGYVNCLGPGIKSNLVMPLAITPGFAGIN